MVPLLTLESFGPLNVAIGFGLVLMESSKVAFFPTAWNLASNQTNLQDGISLPVQKNNIFPSSQKIERTVTLFNYWLVRLVMQRTRN